MTTSSPTQMQEQGQGQGQGQMQVQLEVQHETRYLYAATVSLAHHLACLQPWHDEHQQLLDFSLDIDPLPAQLERTIDSQGHVWRHFSLVAAHRHLHVRARSRVQLSPRFARLDAAASPPWEPVAERLRYVAQAPYEPAVAYVQPSVYVPRMMQLRDYALASFTPQRPLAAAAIDLMRRVHTDFAYASGSTQVDTPLREVWQSKRGVCQDFAHLMIGALRMLGLPARYVSGYLLTQAPGGGAPLVGADASHAWLQLWCPGTPGVPTTGAHAHWLDLDPTNNLVPAHAHVRVAVGRDFGDVTPLRGVIRGSGGHSLSVAVSTRVLPQGEPQHTSTPLPVPKHKLLD
jgi:transglutaminase-like putative cysteine protease